MTSFSSTRPQFKVGTAKPSGSVKLVISTFPLGEHSDDGISGITGMTSDAGSRHGGGGKADHDLEGERAMWGGDRVN